ncbi:MAG: transketolase family protein [Spirochaetia bacterium]|nr:transketolase family protein [Spirochaetia bacterium]MCF7941563.1 transketolase family protein [Spirochaetia bacterium]
MAKDMRDVYAQTLVDLAENDDRICVLEADLMNATGTKVFKQRFPERMFDVGVAEANMVGVASGLSAEGKIPFAASFGTFASRRTFDQFFLSANYAQLNVKLVGTDPGITAQFNGGTHMPFEDIGMMRLVPNLVIIEPSDLVSCEALIRAAAAHQGSMYIRMHRKGSNTIYDENEQFELGKGKVLVDGTDVTLIAAGFVMVPEALKAAEILKKEGISAAVIDMHTIKPLDNELVLAYAKKTGAIVTCENHQVTGGLGGAVAELLTAEYPALLGRIGAQDMFGQVGTQDYLIKAYEMTAEDIAQKAMATISKK